MSAVTKKGSAYIYWTILKFIKSSLNIFTEFEIFAFIIAHTAWAIISENGSNAVINIDYGDFVVGLVNIHNFITDRLYMPLMLKCTI